MKKLKSFLLIMLVCVMIAISSIAIYGSLDVVPDNSEISVTENPENHTYNGEAQSLGSVTPNVNGAVISYKVNGGSYSAYAPYAADAGLYTVGYKVEKAGCETVEGTFEAIISPKYITVFGTTADGKFYDGNTDAVVHLGTVSGIADGDDVTVTLSGTFDSANAGNGKNVAITYTLSGAKADNYTIEDEYTWADIERKKVTVTAYDASKTYGEEDPKLTAKVDGLVGTDSVNYTITRAEGEDAGTYAITPSGNASQGNYAVTYVDGTFTINQKAVTVTANDASKTYGENDPTFTAKAEGTFGTDSVNYTITRAEGKDAGTYAITPSGDASQGNYAVTYVDGTFTINQKAVTVTANDASKTYGEEDPKLTAKVDGLVGTDSVNYTITRAEGKDAGTYAITPTGDASQGNYAVTYVDGTFTINQKAVTVSNYSPYTFAYNETTESTTEAETETEAATGNIKWYIPVVIAVLVLGVGVGIFFVRRKK